MKTFSQRQLFREGIIFIFICLFINLNTFLYAEKGDDLLKELKLKSEDFLKQGHYLEFLEYLSAMRNKQAKEDMLFIDYYMILTKSAYLDSLEQKQDWKNYYDNVHKTDKEVIETTEVFKTYSLSSLSIDVLYLAWKAHIREEDGQEEQFFDQLVKQLIKFTNEKRDNSKFKEIVEKLSRENKVKYVSKLFDGYKNYIVETKADDVSIGQMAEMAKDYLSGQQIDMARIIYEYYINLVLERYHRQQSIQILRDVVGKFVYHGFLPAKDAEFAEKVYSLMEKQLGVDSLSEADIFLRGYNLNMLGDYPKAFEKYKQFVDTFKNSKLLDEIYTRLGIISFYGLKAPEKAITFFEKVINDFPDSPYMEFCAYETALIYQWKQEEEKAAKLYSRLIKPQGKFRDLAQQRLDEINSRLGMDRSVRHPFDLMFGLSEGSPIIMSLTTEPNRGFVHGEIKCIGAAQDYSAGTVQPLFTYEWYRDTGSVGIPGNVNEFTTTYPAMGPKIICFSATSGNSENIICRDLWIYEIIISSPVEGQMFRVNDLIQFEAYIFPATIMEENRVNWKWKITGEENISGEGKSFNYKFTKPGHYEGEVEICIDTAVKGVKKFVFDIVK